MPGAYILDTSDWSIIHTFSDVDSGASVEWIDGGATLLIGHRGGAPWFEARSVTDWSVIPGTPSFSNPITKILISQDAGLAVLSDMGDSRVYSVSDWSPVSGFPLPNFGAADHSPTDPLIAAVIASASNKGLQVVDVNSMALSDYGPDATGYLKGVTFSPDGGMVAYSTSGTSFAILNTSGWGEVTGVPQMPGDIEVLKWLPGDKIAVGVRYDDANLRIVDASSLAVDSGAFSMPGSNRFPMSFEVMESESEEHVVIISGASPLGSPSAAGIIDIDSGLRDIPHLTRYTCTVTDGGQSVAVPISSWQATIQEGAASYAQVVVPAFGAVADQVMALDQPDFIIYREARTASGGMITRTQMARAPMSITINRGPKNYTATLSGYALLTFPEIAGDINVTGVRSETSGSDRRIRCDIAWGVKPGRTISANGSTLRVDYVNYYVIARPVGIESYMDVGERSGG
jgi:hypothetical protein